MLFSRCQSQWRWVGAGMGGALRTGLDYGAVQTVMTWLGLSVTETPSLMDDLQLLETEALRLLNR